jgi:hypothetical protein
MTGHRSLTALERTPMAADRRLGALQLRRLTRATSTRPSPCLPIPGVIPGVVVRPASVCARLACRHSDLTAPPRGLSTSGGPRVRSTGLVYVSAADGSTSKGRRDAEVGRADIPRHEPTGIKGMTPPEEAGAWGRAAAGDGDAFGRLFDAHSSRVYKPTWRAAPDLRPRGGTPRFGAHRRP